MPKKCLPVIVRQGSGEVSLYIAKIPKIGDLHKKAGNAIMVTTLNNILYSGRGNTLWAFRVKIGSKNIKNLELTFLPTERR